MVLPGDQPSFVFELKREGIISKTAFVFPGQGSQFVGMARDLHENIAEVRELYDEARHIVGFDLAETSFNGPAERLKQTQVTQPAIFVHSAAVTRIVKSSGLRPDMTAGHSLGEYSALFAAGGIDFAQALRLVKIRAELMQRAGEIERGTMAAVIGVEIERLTDICEEASSIGVVQVANLNSASQAVISGSLEGVEKAIEMAKEAGAKRAIPLVVGGAFHSPLMASAVGGLVAALDAAEIKETRVPVYSNVHAQPVTTPDQIRACLKRQLTSPVRWLESVENMIGAGATEFVEVGPGNVLTGLLKRIDRRVSGRTLGTLEGLATLEAATLS